MTNLYVNDEYRVNLDIFEGPLDLLLYLIKKNDLDVYDIPIAFVLEKYMVYLDTLKDLNIDLAGEFLLMAAELAHVKSKMLLPDEGLDEEAEEEDPRSDLVRRLLEYQQYKEASETLTERSMLSRDVFVPQTPERLERSSDGPVEGDIFELVEAFSKMIQKAPPDGFHDIAVDQISVSERIYQIIGMIKKGVTIAIEELMGEDLSRYNIVVTFLALLEMCRLKMVRVYQSATFGQIHIQGIMEEVAEDEVAKLIEIDAAEHESVEEQK